MASAPIADPSPGLPILLPSTTASIAAPAPPVAEAQIGGDGQMRVIAASIEHLQPYGAGMVQHHRLAISVLHNVSTRLVVPPREIESAILRSSAQYGVDPALVRAVMQSESGFHTGAVSGKGAQGLMQLMPATAARFGVRNLFDPGQNIQGGTAYLAWLMNHFGGNQTLAVAGYNAGEHAVERWGGVPPYSETQTYVSRVQGLYARWTATPLWATTTATATNPLWRTIDATGEHAVD